MSALMWSSSSEYSIVSSVQVVLSTISIHTVVMILSDVDRFSDPSSELIAVIFQDFSIVPVNYMVVL